MRDKNREKRLKRLKRHLRARKKVFGTPERPRLVVFRSLRHIYAQIIDDTKGHTLVSACTLSPAIRDDVAKMEGKVAKAFAVGEYLAKLAEEKGIKKVVFDKAGYRYHGRVKALADGARKGGLEF